MGKLRADTASLDLKGTVEELKAFRKGLPMAGLPVVIRGHLRATATSGYSGVSMSFLVDVESVSSAAGETGEDGGA